MEGDSTYSNTRTLPLFVNPSLSNPPSPPMIIFPSELKAKLLSTSASIYSTLFTELNAIQLLPSFLYTYILLPVPNAIVLPSRLIRGLTVVAVDNVFRTQSSFESISNTNAVDPFLLYLLIREVPVSFILIFMPKRRPPSPVINPVSPIEE